ncbi:ATP-binding cassette sub-family A member 13 [Platysternon megacephalum]|uniref:ATP-binding cassette sub-family A member 13 n=1 Tax=Platysternon megacephalum TaxID=55544 RepID=A0A4D9EDU7_9SAUR|nr:ATP-binding cassette sub-family A member 13 [Platysternon megacephalum]
MQLLYGKLKIIKLKGYERHNMCWRCGSLLRSPSAGIADELSVQQSLEGNLETILPFYRSEASNFFLLLIEDSAEDFDTELSLFNELSNSSDLVSYPQYLPYYRTHEEFFINPVSLDTLLIRAEVEEGDIGREKREGSGGCKINTIREDETLSNLVISTGYFPYYRSSEEHFGSQVLHDGLSITAEGKEANRESNEKRGDVCEVAVGYSDKRIPQSYKTEKEAISSMPNVEPSGSLLLTDSITENGGSEISLLNGLSRLNQPFSPTGYFPYYRTYGELLISPASHDGFSTSSTEVRDDVGSETAGKGKSSNHEVSYCPGEHETECWEAGSWNICGGTISENLANNVQLRRYVAQKKDEDYSINIKILESSQMTTNQEPSYKMLSLAMSNQKTFTNLTAEEEIVRDGSE